MNNEIVTLLNGNAVTTSLAIAEGTDTQHKNVLELVRTYLADLKEFGGVAFETRPFETAGGTQHREIAILNEQQSTLVLTFMRNSEIVVGFKKRLVKAFWEMAKKLSEPKLNPANLSRLQLIELAMQAEQERLVLEAENKILKPKAEITDRIANADGALGLQAAAKALQQQPNKFCDWLRQIGWIYRRPGSSANLGYQDKVHAGYLTHKVHTIHKDDGTEKVVEQVMITTKGLIKLAELLNVKIGDELPLAA